MRYLLCILLLLLTHSAHAQPSRYILSGDGASRVYIQNDGNAVVQWLVDGVWVIADAREGGWSSSRTIKPKPDPPPPPPPPPPHSNPIRGELREVDVLSDSAHFEDGSGQEVLPVGFTWFGALEVYRYDRPEFDRILAAASSAGMQFARILFAVADLDEGGYWAGHEILPHDITYPSGKRVPAMPDYEGAVVGLGRAFEAAGMQVYVSSGGLGGVFGTDTRRASQWSRRIGVLLNASGVRVAFVDVNESWQNWFIELRATPDDVYRYIIEPFEQGYAKPLIALRSSPSANESTDALNVWAGDIIDKHGHRGWYPQDHVSAVRHARGIFYTGDGPIPDKRVGIESEPVGPGASVQTLNDPEALALLAAANFTGGFAFVFHSDVGVRSWIGAVDAAPGFFAVPKVHTYLPQNLQSAYTVRLHGGLSQSPLTDGDGFPGENRVDSVLTEDGRRFVTLVYGADGYTRLLAREAVRFTIVTPDTGESHSFTLMAGEALEVYYRAGRVLIGEVL